MDRVKTISVDVLLSSELLSIEESDSLRLQLEGRLRLTASEVIELDLPAKNRVEALLRSELLDDKQLRELACDFAEHTLHVFEEHAPRERRPLKCIEAARLFLAGESFENLKAAIKEAIPAVWQLHRTKFMSAFTAGLAVTFLDYQDAAEMALPVALHAQRAAHYKEWETRKSGLELMIGREKEATWQLIRIAEILS
jgi:hypothetical protein